MASTGPNQGEVEDTTSSPDTEWLRLDETRLNVKLRLWDTLKGRKSILESAMPINGKSETIVVLRQKGRLEIGESNNNLNLSLIENIRLKLEERQLAG